MSVSTVSGHAGYLADLAGADPTERQIEVVRLAAEGLTDAEIGLRLYVTGATVKQHLRRLFAKLGARNRAHAVHLAYQAGYLRPPGPPRPLTTTVAATEDDLLRAAREAQLYLSAIRSDLATLRALARHPSKES